ncbi:hypothetical protein FMEAI12_1880006 [Parafrankia sp. Ea1.12]|nr:hypothetical protein FMEAI12_1880006 [Parafrankia sp. Ea1.12]
MAVSIFSMRPTISWPAMEGKAPPQEVWTWPRKWSMSLWHRPVASTRRTAPPGWGSGTGRSRSSQVSSPLNTMARLISGTSLNSFSALFAAPGSRGPSPGDSAAELMTLVALGSILAVRAAGSTPTSQVDPAGSRRASAQRPGLR